MLFIKYSDSDLRRQYLRHFKCVSMAKKHDHLPPLQYFKISAILLIWHTSKFRYTELSANYGEKSRKFSRNNVDQLSEAKLSLAGQRQRRQRYMVCALWPLIWVIPIVTR